MLDVVSIYQTGVNGIPPTGRAVRVAAISIHRVEDGTICDTWEVVGHGSDC